LLGTISVISFYAFKLLQSSGAEPTPVPENTTVQLSINQIEKIPLAEEIATNLKRSENSAEHYVKIKLSIGVNNTHKKESPEIIESLAVNETVTRDIVLGILRNLTYEELSIPEGQDLLKEIIKTKLQEEYDTNLIVQVYISDLVLQ
jgi:flagellar basal body-associated protein FliL